MLHGFQQSLLRCRLNTLGVLLSTTNISQPRYGWVNCESHIHASSWDVWRTEITLRCDSAGLWKLWENVVR